MHYIFKRMKKITSIFISIIFFYSLCTHKTIGFSSGGQREEPIKLEGKKIKFKSIPKITLKDFLIGTTNGKQSTITVILTLPSNKLTNNLPVVIIFHGSGGIAQ